VLPGRASTGRNLCRLVGFTGPPRGTARGVLSGLSLWPELLVRGVLGAVVFTALFLAARIRWKERDSSDGTTDIGLD
jgi:hypothetical protein